MHWSPIVLCAAASLAGAAAGRLSTTSHLRRLRTEISILSRAARHDPLCGVLNRAGLEQAYTSTANQHRYVILIDLDGFKSANDQHGHPAGDRVLSALGSRLADLASPFGGMAGRLGGDEFALILPTTSRDTAESAATSAAAALGIADLPTGPLTVSGSAGMAFAPAGYPWTRALTDADIALYQSKRTGAPVTYQHGMTYPHAVHRRRRARDTTGL